MTTTNACDEVRELMRQALADEGAPAAAIEIHVAGCATCADWWDTQRDVRALLAAREPVALPAGFGARLAAALDEADPWWMAFDWRWWTLRAAPVAAALALLVGGATVGTTSAATSDSSLDMALAEGASTVSNDSLLLAVLSGSPDDTVTRYEGSSR